MKKEFLLLLVLFAVSFVWADVVTVCDGDTLGQDYYDNPGPDGVLYVVNGDTCENITIYINAIVRDGVDVYYDEGINTDCNVRGSTINGHSIIGDNSLVNGGRHSNTSGTGSAFYIDGDNNIISDAIVDEAVTGIYVNERCSGFLIDNCHIYNTQLAGIDVRHHCFGEIIETVVDDVRDYGINIHKYCEVSVNSSVVVDSRHLLHIGKDSRVNISESIFYNLDPNTSFRSVDIDSAQYVNIRFSSINGDSIGVYGQYSDSIYISNCLLGNSLNAVSINNTNLLVVHNNNILDSHNGLWLDYLDSCYVYNNIFARNDLAVGSEYGNELRFFSYNHFYETEESWRTNLSLNSTFGNPVWINETAYELDTDSPCYGTGWTSDGSEINRGMTGITNDILPGDEDLIFDKPEFPNSINLTAYPNPFNSVINVETESFSVYDLNGKIIARVKGSRWAPQGVVSGVYVIQDNSGGMARVVYQK